MTQRRPYEPPKVTPLNIEAPADITATELFEVLLAALDRCGEGEGELAKAVAVSARSRKGFLLGLVATCVSVMRERGWTVQPPRHHTPIEPR